MVFEHGVDIDLLAQRLRQVAPGETITYADLSKVIARDVQGRARPNLDRARARLLREHIRFHTEKALGLRRMTADEVARSGAHSTRKIRRVSRREGAKMTAIAPVDYEALAPDARAQQQATLCVIQAVAHFATDKQHKRLTEACAQNLAPLSLAATVEHFSKKL